VWCRALVLGIVLAVTACSSGGDGDADADAGRGLVDRVLEGSGADGPECEAADVRLYDSGLPEAVAQGDDAETWALLWAFPPWEVGEKVKVVWRMTGTGDFTVRAVGPDGEVVEPVDGPAPHSSANWHRPGDEWGTAFSLPSEGCWLLEAQRGDAVSTIGILVIPA
jgi:hypothetical protein